MNDDYNAPNTTIEKTTFAIPTSTDKQLNFADKTKSKME